MARKVKRGLDYFPLDVNFTSDIKIRKLIKYEGGNAISIYIILLCKIYEDGYYLKWDNDLPFIIAEQTGFAEELIEKVIKKSVEFGLFSQEIFNENSVLTSSAIQCRFKEICSLSKRKSNIVEFNLLEDENVEKEELTPSNSELKSISSEETAINSEEMPINSELIQQRKEKESKVKKRTSLPPFLEEEKKIFFFSKIAPLIDAECRDSKVDEFLRLSSNWTDSAVCEFLCAWADNPSRCEWFRLLQELQHYERTEKIHPTFTWMQWQCEKFLSRLPQAERAEIETLTKGRKDERLLKLIETCIKQDSKINLPGRFIISELKKAV